MEGHRQTPVILAIDIGNTRVKVGKFVQGRLVQTWQGEAGSLEQLMADVIHPEAPDTLFYIGWVSVNQPILPETWACWHKFSASPHCVPLTADFPFPIKNAYKTPATLGTDRLLAVLGALDRVEQPPVLVVDIGTAVTYDIVDQGGTYLGGGISPGMYMRFKALASFTARLPEVAPQKNFSLVGNTTHGCIRSGVVNGLLEELEGIIARYHSTFSPGLKVVLTGGDADFFEKRLKSINFVEQNLVLWGIHSTLLHTL